MSLLTNLSAHWKLNEGSGTRNDSHGTNHLTDNNTVASATGKIGDAASFISANSEYLSIADNAALSMDGDELGFALWIKTASSLSGTPFILGKGTNWSLFLNGAVITFRLAGSDLTGGTLSTSTWYFICCTHKNSDTTKTISVNAGTRSTTSSGTHSDDAGSFFLGALDAGPILYFDGLIDSVSVWKRVITTTEESDLYNGGSGLDYESFGPATARAPKMIRAGSGLFVPAYMQ